MSEDKKELGFLDHLEELRWCLIRSAIAILVFTGLAFVFKSFIFDGIILAPKSPDFITNKLLCKLSDIFNTPILCINKNSFEIKSIYMAGQFMAHIKISIIAGIILAFPYVVYEIWKFIKPALYPHEIKAIKGVVFYTSLLFIIGILFGYYIITPMSINFLGSYKVSESVANEINLMSYVSTVTSVTLATGIVFELPIFIMFLSKINLVTPAFLRKYRRHAIIGILIFAAIITPPDIFSQILVSIPMIILYEISILISKKIQNKSKFAG